MSEITIELVGRGTRWTFAKREIRVGRDNNCDVILAADEYPMVSRNHLLLRLEGRVFFANAERIAEKIGALIKEAKPKIVALDLSAVFDLEYTALKMVTEGEKRQRARGVSLWLVGLNPDVLAMVKRSPLGEVLGRERMHFNLEVAVARYLASFTSVSGA